MVIIVPRLVVSSCQSSQVETSPKHSLKVGPAPLLVQERPGIPIVRRSSCVVVCRRVHRCAAIPTFIVDLSCSPAVSPISHQTYTNQFSAFAWIVAWFSPRMDTFGEATRRVVRSEVDTRTSMRTSGLSLFWSAGDRDGCPHSLGWKSSPFRRDSTWQEAEDIQELASTAMSSLMSLSSCSTRDLYVLVFLSFMPLCVDWISAERARLMSCRGSGGFNSFRSCQSNEQRLLRRCCRVQAVHRSRCGLRRCIVPVPQVLSRFGQRTKNPVLNPNGCDYGSHGYFPDA
jgi:hypothetical protein